MPGQHDRIELSVAEGFVSALCNVLSLPTREQRCAHSCDLDSRMLETRPLFTCCIWSYSAGRAVFGWKKRVSNALKDTSVYYQQKWITIASRELSSAYTLLECFNCCVEYDR